MPESPRQGVEVEAIGVNSELPFVQNAENGWKEPKLLDAAPCTNVGSSGRGQKRDKTKPGFAKGLWHRIFQRLRAHHRQ